MGGRGMSLPGNLLDLDRVEIRAVCDIVPDRVQRAQQRVVPRPYSRINLISGTRGTFADYPPRLHLEG